ncbi:hypothetical protein LC613_34260 [Nostoc sphaeroides CHAB 2801]|uniref:hypothetical protein n=1 Tax=Nostoc sphaeroides TaxID=446679 RepID=UPI001E4B4F8D|nr:hypothetical protein [Nostoc sphaeroides]MCC5632665.1 hypothetical protein [Nostoc sphaeroides CHAB 2801]
MSTPFSESGFASNRHLKNGFALNRHLKNGFALNRHLKSGFASNRHLILRLLTPPVIFIASASSITVNKLFFSSFVCFTHFRALTQNLETTNHPVMSL